LRELALHILDIAENSISANPEKISILVNEDIDQDILRIVVEDNGKGMDPETLKRAVDPFVTSRTTRSVGLGIPFMKLAAEACDGSFSITSQIDHGTRVEASFRHSHIDRMPLGNIADTLLALIVGTPEVHWVVEYKNGKDQFIFDSKPIKEFLGEIPFSDPGVIKYIRTTLEEGLKSAKSDLQVEKLYVPT